MLDFHGTASLYDVWGDFIVYRNLVPMDSRLPSFQDLHTQLGLAANALPRKTEPEYGRVVAEIIRCARELDLPHKPIRNVVYLGDTQLLDGTAFANLCKAGGWDGWAFIGRDDRNAPLKVDTKGAVYVSNRWSALKGFEHFLQSLDFPLDEQTALVVDMDKTAAGARGRNDKPIDEARLEGVRVTMASLLGRGFDEARFRTIYSELNQPQYHHVTADNQDYLAYVCLMIMAGLFHYETIVKEIKEGSLKTFTEFITRVHNKREMLPEGGLSSLHAEFWRCFQEGDPTPFKTFRRNEYLTTSARYRPQLVGNLEQTLKESIVITREVVQFANDLRPRGVLVFGLSDKPDEASLPTHEQAEKGFKPLHRLETMVVGD